MQKAILWPKIITKLCHFNLLTPSTFQHFHKCQDYSTQLETESHRNISDIKAQSLHISQLFALRQHLTLVSLTRYPQPQHPRHIFARDHTLCPLIYCFVHRFNTFFWTVVVTTIVIVWVNLSIPLLPKHGFIITISSVA